MAAEDIVINVDINGAQKLNQLSTGVIQLYKALAGTNNVMRQTNAASRALSQAVGSTGRSMNDHAKSVGQLVRNQSTLSREIGKVNRDLKELSRNFATLSRDEQKAIAGLQRYGQSLKNIKARALVSDLQSIAREQKRLGKDAQFVGRSLIIGLTTPLIAMGRYGLQSLVAIDKETVRLNKVLESVAPNAEAAAAKLGSMNDKARIDRMVRDFNDLNNSLTQISQKFGVAKSMTVSLAADFAELGITNEKNISKLTELTAATEKLGSMDISASQDLVQSLYFQAVRSFDQSGRVFKNAMEREKAAIDAATAQLSMFNLVENTTALTLRDLGDAFPEVAAAATSFGLSMTEAAALLAPMKAAGFEVGASANSIKVSLQRLTAPTKQNADMFKELSKQYGVTFNQISGTGLDAIQGLVDSFNKLRDSAAGQEGALEFMAKVFGVRQGPRMEVAIQQVASFDKLLKNASASGNLAEKRIQQIANTTISGFNSANKTAVPLINSFRDIGVLARIATAQAGQMVEGFGVVNAKDIATAREARKAIGDELLKANREGRDLIAEISTEAGRAMVVELAGAKNAQAVADRELDASLKSLDTKLSILKNNFKLFAADLVQTVKPIFEKIVDASTKLYHAWSQLTPQTKELASKIVLAVGAIVAAVGPLVFIFGQMRLATGVLGGALFKFLPSLKMMSIESLAGAQAMTRLTNPITLVGNTIQNTNGKFATFIATLASGNGPLATFASKLGVMTGVLQKTTTADASIMAALTTTGGKTFGMADDAILGAIGNNVKGLTKPIPPPIIPTTAAYEFSKKFPGGTAGTSEQLFAKTLQLEQQGFGVSPTGGITGPSRLRKGGKFVSAEKFLGKQDSKLLRGLSESRQSATLANQAALLRRDEIVTPMLQQQTSAMADAARLRRGELATKNLSSRLGRDDSGRLIKQRLFKGREISESSFERISAGGIRGKATSGLLSMKGLALKPVDAFKKAIDNSSKSVMMLQSKLKNAGQAQPGIFKKAAAAVKGFANSFGLVTKAMNLMKLAWIATGIGAAILAVAAIVYIVVKNFDKFKTIAKPGIDAIKEAVGILKDALFALIKPFINLFATIGGGGKDSSDSVKPIAQAFNVLGESLKVIAKIIGFIFGQLGKVIQFLLGGVLSSFRGVINLVQGIIKIFKGDFKEGFSQAFKGLIQGVYGLMGPFRKVFDFIISLVLKFVKVAEKGLGWVPGLGGGIKKAASALEGFQKMLKESSNIKTPMTEEAAKGAIGIKTSVKKVAPDIQETISNAVGDGFETGADSGASKTIKTIKDVKKEIKKAALDAYAGYVQDAVDAVKESFAKQKEAALAVFDSQLDTIDKLKQADESLTKTKEYESNKRALIEERELNRQNYVRNRALAIYEGRIDDARMLGLEEKKSILDSTRQKEQLEESRRRDLAEENLTFLKKSIEEARKEAGKYFDDAVKNFEESATKITKFPPTSIQSFENQISQLTNAAKTESTNIQTEFTTLYDNLQKSITENMPNKVVGLFSNNLSDIVTEAKNKFGLENPVPGTVVGETVGLIAGISEKFGNDTSIRDSFGTGITGAIDTTLSGWATTMKDLTIPGLLKGIEDSMKPYTDAEGSWKKAIEAGMKAVLESYKLAIAEMDTRTIELSDKMERRFANLLKRFNQLSNETSGGGGGGGGGAGTTGEADTTAGGIMPSGEASAANKRLYEESLKPKNIYEQLSGVITSNQPTTQYIAQTNLLKLLLGGKTIPANNRGAKGYYKASWLMPNGDEITNSYTPRALIESAWLFAKVQMGKSVGQFKQDIGGSAEYDKYIKKANIKPDLKRYGGYVRAAASQSVPAFLHGGEFVISAGAVNKMGIGALQSINNMRFQNPAMAQPKVVSENYSTQNVNIYVDNFIGQEQWFESMMKDYNVKVVPRNQKAAGLENRVVRTYNGINRGM